MVKATLLAFMALPNKLRMLNICNCEGMLGINVLTQENRKSNILSRLLIKTLLASCLDKPVIT